MKKSQENKPAITLANELRSEIENSLGRANEEIPNNAIDNHHAKANDKPHNNNRKSGCPRKLVKFGEIFHRKNTKEMHLEGQISKTGSKLAIEIDKIKKKGLKEIQKDENEEKMLYKFKPILAGLFNYYKWMDKQEMKRIVTKYVLDNNLFNKDTQKIEFTKDPKLKLLFDDDIPKQKVIGELMNYTTKRMKDEIDDLIDIVMGIKQDKEKLNNKSKIQESIVTPLVKLNNGVIEEKSEKSVATSQISSKIGQNKQNLENNNSGNKPNSECNTTDNSIKTGSESKKDSKSQDQKKESKSQEPKKSEKSQVLKKQDKNKVKNGANHHHQQIDSLTNLLLNSEEKSSLVEINPLQSLCNQKEQLIFYGQSIKLGAHTNRGLNSDLSNYKLIVPKMQPRDLYDKF